MIRGLTFSLALLAAPVLADTVEINTYRGPATVPLNPEKIVVFDIAALDTLDALGIKPDGVVQPVYVDYLEAAAKDAAPVGSLFEPDFEALAAMQPDLIIAGGRSHEAVPDLAKLAPTIDMTIWEDVPGQAIERLTAYGAIFGKESEAAALETAFNTQLDATKQKVAGNGKALILMTNGPKVSAYGAKGRFGWIHKVLDLPEAVSEMEDTPHGEAISFEFIRNADPDILLVIDRQAAIGRGTGGAEATLDNALVHETKAWKNGKVIYLDSARIYVAGGGIQSLGYTLDQIASAF